MPYIVRFIDSENEILKQCLFSKAKRTTNSNMEILCLGLRLLRVFEFGRYYLLKGKRISIIKIFQWHNVAFSTLHK